VGLYQLGFAGFYKPKNAVCRLGNAVYQKCNVVNRKIYLSFTGLDNFDLTKSNDYEKDIRYFF
jgi:hypothetical protein